MIVSNMLREALRNNYGLKAILAIVFAGVMLVHADLQAQIKFKDITKTSGFNLICASTTDYSPGMIVFDYDNDGWDDIYCVGGIGDDALYHNNHDGSFTDVSEKAGVAQHGRSHTHGGVAFDYNLDGYVDLFVTCENHSILYRNNGDGTFTDVTKAAGIIDPPGANEDMSATVGDFNGDGYPDLYIARWADTLRTIPDPNRPGAGRYDNVGLPNFLYVNNGNGTFLEDAAAYGVNDGACSVAALFVDYDRDGDLDLIVGNDFGPDQAPNHVYKNMLSETGVATFKEVGSQIGMDNRLFCMGIGVSDYDRDGDFDFAMSNIGPEPLMQNDGNHFHDVAAERGTMIGYFPNTTKDTIKISRSSWTPLFSDFDNDGWEDLFMVYGSMPTIQPWHVYEFDTSTFFRNTGGSFERMTPDSTGMKVTERGRAGALIDFNRDGKMDIVYGPLSFSPVNPSRGYRLYQNETPSTGHWLEMKLHGTTCGREAIGTCVEVWTNGIRHLRQVTTGGAFMSMSTLTQHFGLANASVIDSILIFWPRRPVEKHYRVPADRIIEYTEGASSVGRNAESTPIQLFPLPAHNALTLSNLDLQSNCQVYDLIGRKMLERKLSGHSGVLNLSGLIPGSYLLRIQSPLGSTTKRFIKE